MYECGEVMCRTVTYSVLYTTMKHQLVSYYLSLTGWVQQAVFCYWTSFSTCPYNYGHAILSYTIGGLTVYQCKANFSDSSNQFALSLNKNDMVKVLDKQDHGTWVLTLAHNTPHGRP